MEYLVVKWLHVLSSTLIFGTGLGTAWYMFFASRSRNATAAAVVLRWGVIADWAFTATTVVFQPLSGLYLVHLAQLPIGATWIRASLMLFAVAVACWLPVVWLQMQMRNLAQAAAREGRELPPRYFTLLRIWTALGFPAFFALVAVFWLMVAKPA